MNNHLHAVLTAAKQMGIIAVYFSIASRNSVLESLSAYMSPFKFILFVFIFNCTYGSSVGQNLISNPGFELNKQLAKNNGLSVSPEFSNVPGWKILGWQSFYCHCKVKSPQNWFLWACRSHLYSPKSGCAMIKMVYEENCNSDPDLRSETRLKGCTSYLESKLTEPLEVGSVYEMSFWVYFPVDSIVEASILSNIGFLPTLHQMDMSANNMLNIPKFFHDTIPQGQWFQIKKYIRALCPLEYVVIGVFRNDYFPIVHRFTNDHYPFYFIDDVKVVKIKEDTLDTTIIPTPFCKFYEDEQTRLEVPLQKNISILFSSNSYTISSDQQYVLDSFINAIDTRWKPVYSVVGHTDNIGDGNDSLSLNRAFVTKSYIQQEHHVPDFRMITFGVGSTFPSSSNNSERGRFENRRATVTVTSLSKDMAYYRQCLELANKGSYTQAVSALKQWIRTAKYYEVIFALFDYRLDSLRNKPGWSGVLDEVKSKYRRYYDAEDTFYLDSLRCEDQRYRTLESSILGLSGYFKDFESFNFNYYITNETNLTELDAKNFRLLTDYLNKNEFPRISEIGRRNVEGLIYMMIHAEDTASMIKYIPILKERCLEGDAEWRTWAMLYYKLRLLQNLPQLYGMQSVFIDPEKTQLQLYKLDDINAVNGRRHVIGLGPIVDPEKITYFKKN